MLLKNKIKQIKKFIASNNVLTTLEERYCYSKDASNLNSESKIPDTVVFVKTIEDVQKVVKYANAHKIPIVSRGAGTNMVGACICNEGGIVLNFTKMNKIIDVNPMNMTITVEPGVILKDIKDRADSLGLFYPPDPSNYKISTIGGSIALSSAGAMSYKYGATRDYVLSLKIVTANGELLTLGTNTLKNATGYQLQQLIIGSEGTLGIIVEATLKLIPKPQSKNSILAYFSTIEDTIDAVNKITKSSIKPAAIDFLDNNTLITIEEYTRFGFNTLYKYALLIDIDGDLSLINEYTDAIKSILKASRIKDLYIPKNHLEYEKLWDARRSSYAATTRLAPDVISEDIIVPRDKLTNIINYCVNISNKYSLKICIVGHIGDGNIHPQFVLNLNDENDFRNYQSAKAELYEHVINLGGSISAEHGIGIEKAPYFNKFMDSTNIEYMKSIKKIFDPNNILNPNKLFKM